MLYIRVIQRVHKVIGRINDTTIQVRSSNGFEFPYYDKRALSKEELEHEYKDALIKLEEIQSYAEFLKQAISEEGE